MILAKLVPNVGGLRYTRRLLIARVGSSLLLCTTPVWAKERARNMTTPQCNTLRWFREEEDRILYAETSHQNLLTISSFGKRVSYETLKAGQLC